MIGYGGVIVAAVALYFTVPGASWVFAAVIGLATLTAVGAGVVRNRPRRLTPWLLVAAAVATLSAGDVVATYQAVYQAAADHPSPTVADAFYLAMYPLLGLGLIRLVRSGAGVRDTASLLDALTLTCGLGLLTWIFLINPLITAPDVPLLARVASVAYPLGDVLLVTVLIRMATSMRPCIAVTLLATGLSVLLFADVAYAVLQMTGHVAVGSVVDALYVLIYPAIGLAALHPSMAGLTEPRLLRTPQAGRQRVALLGLAALIPPGVLVTEALTGEVRDALMIGVSAAVLFGLVVARLAGVVAGHRQSVARERGLRRAGAALLAATTVEEVVTAVGAAVADLLPPDTGHEVVVMAGEPVSQREMAIMSSGTGDRVLRCPIIGRRVTGWLDIRADDTALVTLQEAAQVLAGQAALALDGLAAGAEIVQRESETYFRTLVQNAADVIVIVDDDDRVRYASPSATAMFGRDPVGTPLPGLFESPVRVLLDAVRAGAEAPELTDWAVRVEGAPKQVEVACRDLRHEPTVAGVVVTLRDVTEHRRLERELLHRAYYDDLTGLPNRALFTRRLETAVAAGGPVGVLLVGLDDFKVINDAMGHHTGDELLVAVARRLVAVVSPRYAVARLGGDEFGVLVESDDVETPAASVLAAFAEGFRLPGAGVVTCHASVGTVTTETAGAEDGGQLLGRADIALAMAKSGGKGRVCRYETTLHTRILERLQLQAALDRAIANGEFRLVYQPIVALGPGQVRGFEALVRWHHPSRGTVPPLDFIGIAEESGLIVQLGEWVLRTAVATAVTWGGAAYVSVNVSPRQFRAPGFVDLVQRALAEHGLPADRLVLEITESLVLTGRDQERIEAELEALRGAGVRIAIDDFGTGYSSLSYLHRVPVDLIKLDKSFVDTITTSPPQYELVKGIIGLAHALRLAVVAEGIETAADRDLLIDARCEYGQGYLFARPMSADDALGLLTAAPART
jgi:diguanylate cyclase (GGDEF)-like protein/PAS domain S-box-containing protein